MTRKQYCEPSNCGLASTDSAVGRSIARTLDALGKIDEWICEGSIVDDVRDLRIQMIRKLRDDGWRIRVLESGRFQVLPPTSGLETALRDARIVRHATPLSGKPDHAWIAWFGGNMIHVFDVRGRAIGVWTFGGSNGLEASEDTASDAIRNAVSSGTFPIDDGENPQSQS